MLIFNHVVSRKIGYTRPAFIGYARFRTMHTFCTHGCTSQPKSRPFGFLRHTSVDYSRVRIPLFLLSTQSWSESKMKFRLKAARKLTKHTTDLLSHLIPLILEKHEWVRLNSNLHLILAPFCSYDQPIGSDEGCTLPKYMKLLWSKL